MSLNHSWSHILYFENHLSLAGGNVGFDFKIETFYDNQTSKWFGQISTQHQLDYENRKNYDLIIRISDAIGTGDANTNDIRYIINILDSNDCPPKFQKVFQEIVVAETTEIGTVIFSSTVTDLDTVGMIKLTLDSEKFNFSTTGPEEFSILVAQSLIDSGDEIFDLILHASDGIQVRYFCVFFSEESGYGSHAISVL